ncbi:MAG: hypothetical protein QOD02_5606 [Mycobacterium sp.]|nr:hypothetical protein [Mycobacterium sp.]MDT5273480.1 hypothetical protein [Mycobacterium sp.]
MPLARSETPPTAQMGYYDLPTARPHPVVQPSQYRLGFRWRGQIACERDFDNRKHPDDERDGGADLRADRSPRGHDDSEYGGATMDVGCYAVHMLRTFGGSTPEVVSAQAKLRGPQVDRAMTAELRFASGHTGRVRCSMWSSNVRQLSAKVVGDRGELRVLNPVAPFRRLSVR